MEASQQDLFIIPNTPTVNSIPIKSHLRYGSTKLNLHLPVCVKNRSKSRLLFLMLRACVIEIAFLAFVCGGLWVLEYGTRRHHRVKEEDRISELPDDVISLILSRLDMTRDAVRTSVLSKRWKHVYTYVSRVRFSCCKFRKSHCLYKSDEKFFQAMDTFLQHHSGSRITSFELGCCSHKCILNSFTIWENSVGRLRLECLSLRYCHLTTLYASFPKIPTTLKHLELKNIAFTNETVGCILLNCCSLQSIIFKYCKLLLSYFDGEEAQKRVVRHHTQLKEVEFTGFLGTEDEYNFIFYILKSVVYLNRLSIFLVSKPFVVCDLQRMPIQSREEIQEIQRISRNRLQEQTDSENVELIIDSVLD